MSDEWRLTREHVGSSPEAEISRATVRGGGTKYNPVAPLKTLIRVPKRCPSAQGDQI